MAACAAFMEQYGYRFRPADVPVDVGGSTKLSIPPLRRRGMSDYYGAHNVRLALRLLKRPATPEDVRNGEAVFSLAGRGAVRVCKMPKLPLDARWVTLKDYPVLDAVYTDTDAAPKNTIGYEQEGIVWQAEEQLTDGRWRRYYGFVGRYGLAKVPAEEIEFPASWGGTAVWYETSRPPLIPLDEAFDAGWTAPAGLKYVKAGSPPVCRIGAPLVCKLRIRNHCGVERTLPPLAIHRDGVKAPSGAVTVEVRLLHCRACLLVIPLDKTAVWTQITPKAPWHLFLKQPANALAPAEEFDVLQCDLNDQFNLARPGIYRFSVRFATGGGAAYEGDGIDDIIFELP